MQRRLAIIVSRLVVASGILVTSAASTVTTQSDEPVDEIIFHRVSEPLQQ